MSKIFPFTGGGGGGGPLTKIFFQSQHVSSQIWCQKFFPLLRLGTLPRTWTWDPPYLDLDLGPPHPDLDLGPLPTRTWTWDSPLLGPGLGTPPYSDLDLGPPLLRPGLGTPPYPDLDLGPPPPRNVNRQTPVKTVPSRHTTYAGGNYLIMCVRSLSTEATLYQVRSTHIFAVSLTRNTTLTCPSLISILKQNTGSNQPSITFLCIENFL